MPERSERSELRHRRTILLSVAQALIAGIAWATIWLRQLEVPGCGQECNGELLLRTIEVSGWAALAIVVVSTAAVVALGRQRWVWTLPVVGLVTILIGAAIAHQLCNLALAPSL